MFEAATTSVAEQEFPADQAGAPLMWDGSAERSERPLRAASRPQPLGRSGPPERAAHDRLEPIGREGIEALVSITQPRVEAVRGG